MKEMNTKHGKDSICSPRREWVDVAGIPQPVPRVDVTPGQQYADENRRFANVTTVTRTRGGRLWSGFSGGGVGEGHLNYGMLVFSDDDGESWTSPQLVIDTDGEGPIRTDHVVVWTAPDGVLWVMFNQYPEGLRKRRSSLWAITCANPDDQDRHWSAPRKLVDEQNMLNPPTVLRDGTWIFPTGCWIRCEDADLHECRRHSPSRSLISRDNGGTFALGGPLHGDDPPDYDEYTVAERRDGTLVMYDRHGTDENGPWTILQCESADQGQSWTPLRANGIPNARSRLVLMNLQSGNWLLVKHGTLDWLNDDAFRGRSHMTAWISRDEGNTWEGGLMIDEREGGAYPAGFQADDGTIYVSYDRQRKRRAEMLLARFTEDDVLAGKGISDRFALRLLINKSKGCSS